MRINATLVVVDLTSVWRDWWRFAVVFGVLLFIVEMCIR